MLKKVFNRDEPMPRRFVSDADKLSALLESPAVEKQLQERDAHLLQERRRHADEIAKIEKDVFARLPDLDQKISDSYEAILRAQEQLAEARQAYNIIDAEKTAFLHQSNYARGVHETELRLSAPYIGEFLAEIRDLYEKNQNIAALEIKVGSVKNIFGLGGTDVYESNGEAVRSWYSILSKAIADAEAMKLDADFTRFPERIEHLRASIPDPNNFQMQRIEVAAGASALWKRAL